MRNYRAEAGAKLGRPDDWIDRNWKRAESVVLESYPHLVKGTEKTNEMIASVFCGMVGLDKTDLLERRYDRYVKSFKEFLADG